MLKKITIILNQLLLILFAALLIITLTLFQTIGSKAYLLKTLEKNNYYEQVYQQSKSTLEGYTIQLGLEDSILDTLYTKEKVTEDINILIDGIYNQKEITISTDSITQKLDEIIDNKLKENNHTSSQEEQKSIQEFQKTISSAYETEILYSKKYALKLQSVYSKIISLKNKTLIFLSSFTLIPTLIILILNRELKSSIKTISTALLSTSFLLISLKLLLESKFQHILIFSSIFSKLAIAIINDLLKIFFNTGILIGIISIIGIIIGVETEKISPKSKKE